MDGNLSTHADQDNTDFESWYEDKSNSFAVYYDHDDLLLVEENEGDKLEWVSFGETQHCVDPDELIEWVGNQEYTEEQAHELARFAMKLTGKEV